MRTTITVFAVGSLLFASCSSSTNDTADGGTGTGARNAGATGNNNGGGNGATGASNTGGDTNGDPNCLVGNPCSGVGTTCQRGNIGCVCENDKWGSCSILSTGGTTGAGGSDGTGGVQGGSEGGTAGTDTGSGGQCAKLSSTTKASPQVLFFAIDATGSMNDVTASTNGQSKWAALRAVWPEIVAGLPTTWAAGMMEWACPKCPSEAYQPSTQVPIAPLSDAAQVTALANGLTERPLGGFTPTECAYNYAFDQVQSWEPPAEFATAPRFIVLLTDGVPTVTSDCQTLGGIKAGSIPVTGDQYAGLIATVAASTAASLLAGVEIKTFVGGVPGSDDPQGAPYDPMYKLTLLAEAGGTALGTPTNPCTAAEGTVLCPDGTVPTVTAGGVPCDGHSAGTQVNPVLTERGTYCHYDLTQGSDFAAQLKEVLRKVQATLVACTYEIPPPPPEYVMVSQTNVGMVYKQGGVTDIELTRATDDDCTKGGQWYFSARDPKTGLATEIKLCPTQCDTVHEDLDAIINVTFQCIGEQ